MSVQAAMCAAIRFDLVQMIDGDSTGDADQAEHNGTEDVAEAAEKRDPGRLATATSCVLWP